MRRGIGRVGLVVLVAVTCAACASPSPPPPTDFTFTAGELLGPTGTPAPTATAGPTSTPSATSPVSPTGAPSPTGVVRPMPEDRFWPLVDDSARGTGGDPDVQADRLAAALRTLTTQDVAAFHVRLIATSHAIYTWRMSAAGDLMCGSLGDDGFTDFRSWVISLGRKAYTAAVANPDTLAAYSAQFACPGAEAFGAASGEVYQERTTRWPDEDGLGAVEDESDPPSGTRLTRAQAAKAFPHLALVVPH